LLKKTQNSSSPESSVNFLGSHFTTLQNALDSPSSEP
jgi:hypothetical protein